MKLLDGLSSIQWFKSLNPLNLKIIAGFLIVITIMGGGMYLQYKRNESLNKDIGALTQSVGELKTTALTYEEASKLMKGKLKELQDDNTDIRNVLSKNASTITALRKNQQAEKTLTPKQQETIINNRYQNMLACIEKTSGNGSATCVE